jgi:hypothetical protein
MAATGVLNNELYIITLDYVAVSIGWIGRKVAAAAIHMYKLMYNYIFALCIGNRESYV